jgi:acetylornithine deacetylase/succinyl-diaminopimelate desuccinylase-like protein
MKHTVLRQSIIVAATLVISHPPAWAQSTEATSQVQNLLNTQVFKQIVNDMEQNHQRIIDENIILQQVPAPSFKESSKAKLFAKLLNDSDDSLEISIDEVGNVLALRKGNNAGSKVQAVITHMDTVFDENTPLDIKREGTRLIAPGILDNSRGMAAILAIIRGMKAANAKTKNNILFVGSVGEEGLGDLRGVKHLFLEGLYKGRITSMIAVDSGFPDQIIHEAAGSKRYEIHYRGPGGHSYRAFGTVNPSYALANAIAQMAKIKPPQGTTYSVGLIGGGTSVNVIPVDAWMQVDMRSSSNEDLKSLEDEFLKVVKEACAQENSTRSTKNGAIETDIKLIGDRPSGKTPSDNRLVQVALAASASQGWTPKLDSGSTDSNIAMSMGIPAITVAEGVGDFNHSSREYLDIEPKQSLRALQVPLISILDNAGIIGGSTGQ